MIKKCMDCERSVSKCGKIMITIWHDKKLALCKDCKKKYVK